MDLKENRAVGEPGANEGDKGDGRAEALVPCEHFLAATSGPNPTGRKMTDLGPVREAAVVRPVPRHLRRDEELVFLLVLDQALQLQHC